MHIQNIEEIRRRFAEVGLSAESKYTFKFGPSGLPITAAEKCELQEIGRTAAEYVQLIDHWYRRASKSPAGSWLVSVLNTVIPRKSGYRSFPYDDGLPVTFMVDTVWTAAGWRVVEVDVTNRNAMGYPLVMRHLYGLPSVWKGVDEQWRQSGWEGVVQVMADHHRYYEPYFKFFLRSIGGQLVKEENLGKWLKENQDQDARLLDVPILFRSKLSAPRLLAAAAKWPVGIPPKHYLSSKALTTLPWEMNLAREMEISKFLPVGRLLCRTRPLPSGDFFLKFLQSGGAHGTFFNDRERLLALHSERKPKAIWQEALPICTRSVAYYDDNGQLAHGDFYVRVSIFVNQKGEVVDADATCSPDNVVHGSKRSVMTVPVIV